MDKSPEFEQRYETRGRPLNSMSPEVSSKEVEEEEPEFTLDTDKELAPVSRTRQKAVRFAIEAFRRRFYESKEKYRLRKELNKERKKIKKLQTATRRKRMGKQIVEQASESSEQESKQN